MAGYFTKPLTGLAFKFMRSWIMNLPDYKKYYNMIMLQDGTHKHFDGQYRSVLNDKRE